MAEIELRVPARVCQRGRNADADSLEKAMNASVADRNSTVAAINWRFTAGDARLKPHRHCPCH